MRPMFRGDACSVDGISTAGNPLSRLLDGVNGDQMHAQAMREGMLGGPRPMGPLGPQGQMLDPMMARGSGMDQAWAEAGPMRPMGPMMGPSAPEQMRLHMEQSRRAEEAGFYTQGPVMAPPGPADWAQEFGGRPGSSAGPGPMMAPQMRPPGADWAQEFRPPQQLPPGDMEAAFKQAQAGPRPAGQMDMEQAFQGPRPMGGMPMGPMGMGPMMPMMGPMGMGMGPSMMAPPTVEPQVQQPAQQPPAQVEAAPAEASQADMEEAFAEAQQEQADLGQAAQMVEMLKNSGNPKFARSQFVSFIDKVSKGDYQFKDNTVIDRAGNQVEWDTLYDTDAAMATESERQELDNLWSQARSSSDPMPQELEEVWKAAGLEGAPQGMADLERMWNMEQLGDGDLMEQAWNNDMTMEQMEAMWGGGQPTRAEYEFQKDNQYLDESGDLLAKALQLIREGRDREALLCLEAEVQRNPQSSEGWRHMGQLYAELDQDIEAIQCLRKGHEVDPYNLDSLLALGVSCTNELDQLPALRYMRMWIENHEQHGVLVQGLERPGEYEYEAWRRQVTQLFQQAASANPLDADVFVALGVMENINRNYDGAIQALATACRLRPNDHTCWNKLGATLANSGKSEQAVVAYHHGLELKPNYARSWSNLAIAHANLGQHADAARFYLSSLVLNPEATHIWNFLHSAALNMNATGAFEAIDNRDLGACTQLIEGVLDPAALPARREELSMPPDEILANMGL